MFAYVCCHILSVFCHYANMLFLDQHLQRVCALTEIVHHPPPFAFQGAQGLRGITGVVGDKGEKVRYL